MILWDYVDEDVLHPMPVASSENTNTIRRNVCGGMVIRREFGTNMLSVRHVSIKENCSLSKPTNVAKSPEAEENQRAISRCIIRQATEYDRTKDRCM